MKIRLIACAVVLGAFAAGAAPSFAAEQKPTTVASIVEEPPIPADKIPAYIKNAVNSPNRPVQDKALDKWRKPEQMFTFFGIKPGMKVADIWAAGGWTTQMLSLIVGPDGKVYSQNGPIPPRFKKIGEIWHARLKRLKNVVEVDRAFNSKDLLPVPAGSLDAVIINMNYHDMVGLKMDRAQINREIFTALKPGGVYGIVDHSAKAGSGARDAETLHRIDEQLVLNEVEAAGFKLGAASSALRNPKDDRTWLIFKKRGQTDRFMLKFVKPE